MTTITGTLHHGYRNPVPFIPEPSSTEPKKDPKTTPHTQPRISAFDHATMPLGVKPKEAARLIGGSRSEVYRLLRQYRLRAVKRGATLIVLMDSIREHMASLPPAHFGTDRTDAASASTST